MADITIDELQEKLRLAKDALKTISNSKDSIMSLYDAGETPPAETLLAGLINSSRLASEAIYQMSLIDHKYDGPKLG